MIFLLANPETWTWGNTWTVTGLGFGIVLVLLFFLVFILIFFGWIMQKLTAPKAQKEEKPAQTTQSTPSIQNTPAAPAPKPASPADDTAAIAMALYLASRSTKHDVPTSMIKPQARETAWNTKSIGMNNQGL